MLFYIEEKLGYNLKFLFSCEGVTLQKKAAFGSYKDLFTLRYTDISSVSVDGGFLSSKLIINQMQEPEIKISSKDKADLLRDLIDLGRYNINELIEIIGYNNTNYRLAEAPEFDEEQMDYYKYQKTYGDYVSPKTISEHIKHLKRFGSISPQSTENPNSVPIQTPMEGAEVSFFVSINEQQAGPFTIQELQQYVATGEFSPQVLVWREGMPQWEYAMNVPELANIFNASF